MEEYKKSTPESMHLNFGTPHDLSEYAYEEATKMILNWEIENRDLTSRKYSSFVTVGEIIFYTLYVDFWSADLALQIMAKYKNCNVVVEKNRDRYSWKVTATAIFPCRAYFESDGA